LTHHENPSTNSKTLRVVHFFALLILGFATPALAVGGAPSRFCLLLLSQIEVQGLKTFTETQVLERTRPLRKGHLALSPNTPGLAPLNPAEGINRELSKPILDQVRSLRLSQIEELARKWSQAYREELKIVSSHYPLSETHPKLSALAKARLAEKYKKNVGRPRIGAAELELQIAAILIERVQSRTVEQVKATAEQVGANVQAVIDEANLYRVPEYEMIERETKLILERMHATLSRLIPIAEAYNRGIRAALDAKGYLEKIAQPLTATAKFVSGVPELTLPSLGVRGYYEKALGTVVLESSQAQFPNRNGPVLLTDHGDGTVKSNAGSWKYLIPKFVASGFNPIAMSLPMAGMGMRITGLFPTVQYLERRYEWVREKMNGQGLSETPLVLLGRSMGSSKGFAHALLFEGKENLVNAYVLSSFSNPFTFEVQRERVQKQVEQGVITNLVPEMLDSADVFSQELGAALNKLEELDAWGLKLFGDKILNLQGAGDEDSGPEVITEQLEFQKKYAPLSHLYVLGSDYWELTNKGEAFDLDRLEGTHMLFSNNPALQDQYFELNAVIWGFFDYLAESPSKQSEIVQAQKLFLEYRKRFTGSATRTFLDVYRERLKITQEDLDRAEANQRGSRAQRLKHVLEFWKVEKERIAAILASACVMQAHCSSL